ncbi:MAG: gamma-glutamyltransferase [Candidatus Palauibacterales bacterium]|nr:gamma-glutamyltransferase [Candidatus Palauibacterales bacterium]MDP2529827.1 gamma-glutamyltransferase [Candidatus Palauibacterales bacterium]MDP2582845.1 gamma-glutamyltransferase [Candidatus Palauibacterales bacterium]
MTSRARIAAVRGTLCLAVGLTLAVAGCRDAGTDRTQWAAPSAYSFPSGWPYPADARATEARHGMVASSDSLASAAGVEILRAGGNAMDAAIAVQFALEVVHPFAGNIGGGGFAVVRTADGQNGALDFREKAPLAATHDMYVDSSGHVTRQSWTGPLAAGVPGSVAGMQALHERYGSLPWARLLEPAIRMARDGIVVRQHFHDAIARSRDRLQVFAPSAAIYLPGGAPPEVGSTFEQPDLARTLRAIADQGASAFYHGWIADSLVAEQKRDGGIITQADLDQYKAVWRDPIVAHYRGRTIISMPPPSSGGVTLAEMLNLLGGFDLAKMGWHSPDAIHVMVESMRRAYGDRNYYLGDPDVVKMPIAELLSEQHADSLRSSIDMQHASPSSQFNKVPVESTETTHYSVVDSAGDAVSITTTLNGGFGSAVTVRGAGFLLNNEMDDFAAQPGTPNAYGLVQGEANAIAPGKRMLSSMTPTLLLDEGGRLELVTGSPGGSTIITSVLQVITDQIDFGLPPQAAVNAPRFHHQNLPNEIFYERGGLDSAVIAALESRGHELRERDGTWGDVESIFVGADGTLYGASDPRGGGKPIGY